MAIVDKSYHELLYAIMKYGYEYETENRPGIVCKQLSAVNIEIPIDKEFPLITTKQMFTKSIVGELIWFLRGGHNIKYLIDNGINIWTKDALKYHNDTVDDTGFEIVNSISEFTRMIKESDMPQFELWESSGDYPGELGKIYGHQWRNWGEDGFDQIYQLINALRKPNPINRRHIVTAWNPDEVLFPFTALPPCHWSFEVIVRPLTENERSSMFEGVMTDDLKSEEEYHQIYDVAGIPRYGLYLKWNQRSVDTFLGLPFNIASYALLAHIIGRLTNIVPLGIIGSLSNVHIYSPHFEVVNQQLERDYKQYSGCQLEISENKLGHNDEFEDIDTIFGNLQISDFKFNNYESYPALKAEMFEQTKTS